MEKCSWCKHEAAEVFRFVFEDDGKEILMCEECLVEIENEFYKEQEGIKNVQSKKR